MIGQRDAVIGFVLVVIVALGVAVVLARRRTTRIYAWEHGLLYVDGRFERVLPPGAYRSGLTRERLIVGLRAGPTLLPVPAIEVMSSDGLPFRMTATLTCRIVDPRTAHEGEYRAALILAATEALVRLAAGRTLRATMEGRASLSDAAVASATRSVQGCEIDALSVTSIVLPPELRRLASEPERARVEAQAALERARGEHAALRALANAARLMKGNPELTNLRLLQSLSTGGRGATLVLGRDALAEGVPRDSAKPFSDGNEGGSEAELP